MSGGLDGLSSRGTSPFQVHSRAPMIQVRVGSATSTPATRTATDVAAIPCAQPSWSSRARSRPTEGSPGDLGSFSSFALTRRWSRRTAPQDLAMGRRHPFVWVWRLHLCCLALNQGSARKVIYSRYPHGRIEEISARAFSSPGWWTPSASSTETQTSIMARNCSDERSAVTIRALALDKALG